jgi:predicted deacylase
MKTILILFFALMSMVIQAQDSIPTIDSIDLEQIEPSQVKKYWLKMTENAFGQPICIPVIIAKGQQTQPVLGLTAAIHGNEINGVEVIRRVFDTINVNALTGTIIAIPGLNAFSLPLHQRRFIDSEDLNRNFPGKPNGNRNQQYVWAITQKLLPHFDYLVDMHTASFGRENSLYVRGYLKDTSIAKMVYSQDADIILNSSGAPSTGNASKKTRTLRAEAMLKGIPTITIEYGNPQVFQPKMIERGKNGILNLLTALKMTNQKVQIFAQPFICKKSYWLYIDKGGYLDIHVQLTQQLKKGELIATLRNPFGDVIKEYFAPEAGIVIGKSSNPINMSGGRIIHLGILE